MGIMFKINHEILYSMLIKPNKIEWINNFPLLLLVSVTWPNYKTLSSETKHFTFQLTFSHMYVDKQRLMPPITPLKFSFAKVAGNVSSEDHWDQHQEFTLRPQLEIPTEIIRLPKTIARSRSSIVEIQEKKQCMANWPWVYADLHGLHLEKCYPARYRQPFLRYQQTLV